MVVFVWIIGAVLASFCHVVGERLPQGKSFLWTRSVCSHCQRTLRWYELVPVFSFCYVKGTCKTCRQPISILYPVIEILCGCLFVAIYTYSADIYTMTLYVLLTLLFVIITVSDIHYFIIPNRVLGCFAVLFLSWLWMVNEPLWSHLILSVIIGFCLALFSIVTRGGLGFGDVKLYALLGLVLSYEQLIWSLLWACIGGLLYAGWTKLKIGAPLPFAPFIAIGTFMSIVMCS